MHLLLFVFLGKFTSPNLVPMDRGNFSSESIVSNTCYELVFKDGDFHQTSPLQNEFNRGSCPVMESNRPEFPSPKNQGQSETGIPLKPNCPKIESNPYVSIGIGSTCAGTGQPGEGQLFWSNMDDEQSKGNSDLSDIGSVNSGYYSGKPRSKVSPTVSGSSGSNSTFCRICHEGESGETLVAPCQCTGTVALIHRTCLEHWLTSSNSDKCEICKHQYNTTREPRSCVEYMQDSSNQFNVRNLIADTVCFFLLTPLLIVSTYLCILGAHQYFVRDRWEAIGLIVLSLFLIAVYLTWCHVTIKFHFSVWLTWKRTNQRVRLIEIVNNIKVVKQCGGIGGIEPETPRQPPFCSIQITTPNGGNLNVSTNSATRMESDAESMENECDTSRIIV